MIHVVYLCYIAKMRQSGQPNTLNRFQRNYRPWGTEQGNIARECFVNGDFVFWSVQIKLVSLQPKMVHCPDYLEQKAEKGQGRARKTSGELFLH